MYLLLVYDPVFPLDDDLRFYIDNTQRGCEACGLNFDSMAKFVKKNWEKGLRLRKKARWLTDKKASKSRRAARESDDFDDSDFDASRRTRRDERRKILRKLQHCECLRL